MFGRVNEQVELTRLERPRIQIWLGICAVQFVASWPGGETSPYFLASVPAEAGLLCVSRLHAAGNGKPGGSVRGKISAQSR